MGNICRNSRENQEDEIVFQAKFESPVYVRAATVIQKGYRKMKSVKSEKKEIQEQKIEEIKNTLQNHGGEIIPHEEFEQLAGKEEKFQTAEGTPVIGFKNVFQEPPMKFKNNHIYCGEWNEKMQKEGFGTDILPNGAKYKGYWNGDTIDKYGTFIDSKGNYYKGGINKATAEGEGVLEIQGKCKLTGTFHNDVLEGQGEEIDYIHGTTYKGDFVNGVKEGKGVLTFSDGTQYTGDFHDGMFEGHGRLVYADGREYEGEFKSNKMNGEGEFKWKDGKKYKGSYVNDQKHGFGTYYWEPKRYYEGYWVNNKQHGDGMLYIN